MTISDNYKQFIKEYGSSRVLRDEPLSKHTYFKIGGPADLFILAESMQDLVKAVQSAIKHSVPYLILGGGSNVLVTDKGFRGLIIKNKTSKINLKGFVGGAGKGGVKIKHVLIKSEGGVPANMLIRYTLDEGLEGLEDFLGLPGSVGGAIYNNSHHLGKLIGETVQEVEVLDRKGEVKKYSQGQMDFSYDYSRLQKTKETVLSVTFKLKKGDKDKLWEKATAAVKRRSDTQPLGLPSSGCMFKNFDLSHAIRLGTPDQTCSAGFLVDKAGFKGRKVGGAMISDKHANFIINTGSATAQDVLGLVKETKKVVKDKYSIDLEMEVFIVGEGSEDISQ